MINSILVNQNKLGSSWFTSVIGIAMYLISILLVEDIYNNAPLYGFFTGIVVYIFVSLYFAFGCKHSYISIAILGVVFITYLDYIPEGMTLQMTGISCLSLSLFSVIFLRAIRHWNIKKNYPSYYYQPFLMSVIWPDYSFDIDDETSARKAIQTVIRVRKGNDKMADSMVDSINCIEGYLGTEAISLKKMGEEVGNSDLGISEIKFRKLFK